MSDLEFQEPRLTGTISAFWWGFIVGVVITLTLVWWW